MARGNGEGFGVHDDAHRGHHGIEIEKRLALTHEDDVGLGFELVAMLAKDDENLAEDFGGTEIADEAERSGKAEVAVDGAAGLSRDADGLAIFFGHEDSFDGGGIVGRELEEVADGGVGGQVAAENGGKGDSVGFGDGSAKGAGKSGEDGK